MGLLIDVTKCNSCNRQTDGHHGYCPNCGSDDVDQTKDFLDIDKLMEDTDYNPEDVPPACDYDIPYDVELTESVCIQIEVWRCMSCEEHIAGQVDQCPFCNSVDVHYWFMQNFDVEE